MEWEQEVEVEVDFNKMNEKEKKEIIKTIKDGGCWTFIDTVFITVEPPDSY